LTGAADAFIRIVMGRMKPTKVQQRIKYSKQRLTINKDGATGKSVRKRSRIRSSSAKKTAASSSAKKIVKTRIRHKRLFAQQPRYYDDKDKIALKMMKRQ